MPKPSLPPLYVELAHAVGISNPTEDTLLTVMEAVSVLDDAAWSALSPQAQAYFNEAAEQVNNQVEAARILWPTAPLEAAEAAQEAPVTKAPPAKKAPPAETAPVKAAPAKAAPAKAAPAKKARGGPGNRAHGKTWVFRKLCVEHPNELPEKLLERMAAENPGMPLPSRISAVTVLYDVRSILRLLAEMGRLKS